MDINNFNPDAFLADNAAPAEAAPTESPEGFDPDEFLKQAQSEKYGTTGQQVLTGIEGAAQGLAGPLATGAEMGLSKLGVPGLTPEDISARKEENPWVHGIAEVGGLLSPVGEGALIAKAAEHLVPSAVSLGGKIGAAALKGSLEAGMFQGGDEISKAMLGQADPEAPVASALAHMGAAGLFGAGVGTIFGASGAVLKKLGDTKIGSKASQLAEDFGNRWKFNQENPNLTEAVQNEITHYHGATQAAADEVYGANGLKQQAIEKLVPEMNESIAKQNKTIAESLTNKLSEMTENPETYPARLTKKLQEMSNQWKSVVENPRSTSQEVFAATQNMKQELQSWAKFDKRIAPFAPEADFVKTSKELAYDLRNHLEDPAVWKEAAHLQKGINKAFVDFLPAQKDFMGKFTTKVEGEPVIDPGKIHTYVNQLGNPRAEVKQQMMENYINAAEKYRNKIDDLHHAIGVESPIPKASLNAVKSTFGGKQTVGAKLADYMTHNAPGSVGTGLATMVGTGAGAVIGGGPGATAGILVAGKLAPWFEEALGRKVSKYGAETILKTLSSDSAKNIAYGLDHANNIKSGAQKINTSLDKLFKTSGQQVIDAVVSDSDREKLKKYIENGGITQQLKDSQYSVSPEPQKFAVGGEVIPQSTQTQPEDNSDRLGNIYPDHNMMLGAAKGRISQYLAAQKPMTSSKLPFDRVMKDETKEESYNNAIDIALKPLSILNNVSKGTLTPENVRHLTSMYPELHSHLSKKISEKVMQHQLDEEPLAYNKRMSLSLFTGSPLDSTMTPALIQAAQPIPKLPPPEQPQGGGKGKGNAAKLGKSEKSYRTQAQSAEADRTGRD